MIIIHSDETFIFIFFWCMCIKTKILRYHAIAIEVSRSLNRCVLLPIS